MMQVTRLVGHWGLRLRLRSRLRWMLEVEVRNRPEGLIAPDRELELDK